jgi:hypothetical protein
MKLRIGNRAAFLAHTRLAEGLISYAIDAEPVYRRAGIYVGRILSPPRFSHFTARAATSRRLALPRRRGQRVTAHHPVPTFTATRTSLRCGARRPVPPPKLTGRCRFN